MKKEYNTPTLEVIVLESEDILNESTVRDFDPVGDANDTGNWDW